MLQKNRDVDLAGGGGSGGAASPKKMVQLKPPSVRGTGSGGRRSNSLSSSPASKTVSFSGGLFTTTLSRKESFVSFVHVQLFLFPRFMLIVSSLFFAWFRFGFLSLVPPFFFSFFFSFRIIFKPEAKKQVNWVSALWTLATTSLPFHGTGVPW